MRRLLAMAFLAPVPLLACGDDRGADMDFGEDLGPDRFAVLSENRNAKLGLTPEYVYFSLSPQAIEKARSEMREEMKDKEGVGGLVGGLVERTVSKALNFKAKYPVDEIEDIRWEDDRLHFVFTDPDRTLGDGFQIDDEPASEGFEEDAVRAFAAEFRKLKRERAESR